MGFLRRIGKITLLEDSRWFRKSNRSNSSKNVQNDPYLASNPQRLYRCHKTPLSHTNYITPRCISASRAVTTIMIIITIIALFFVYPPIMSHFTSI